MLMEIEKIPKRKVIVSSENIMVKLYSLYPVYSGHTIRSTIMNIHFGLEKNIRYLHLIAASYRINLQVLHISL